MSTLAKSLAPRSIDDDIAGICGQSLLRAAAHIKKLAKNDPACGPGHLREVFESALTREVRSKTQRRSIIQALKNALKKIPADPLPTPPSKLKQDKVKVAPVEVIRNKEAVLTDAARSLGKLRSIVATHEEKFLAATLGPRLQIGLQCLKAHHVFSIPEPGKRGQGRKKNHVTRDVISPEGFEGWLATEAQWLKKPTAYKYMTAVRGLGLDHAATEKQVAAALGLLLRKGPVTIASLCAAALEAIAPPAPKPPRIEQQEFDFLKQACTSLREEVESLVAIKDQLDAYPDFKRAATARLYAALHDLTGTHWQPSDEPDALALVDPDAITL